MLTTNGSGIGRVSRDAQRQSVGELFSELASLSSGLIRDEFALAKHEIREKLSLLRTALIMTVVAAVIAQAALLAFAAAAALAVAPFFGAWRAVLLIGALLAIASTILAFVGMTRLNRVSLKPEQTIETLEEDKQWLKQLT